MTTDHNEAMRLADALDAPTVTHHQVSGDWEPYETVERVVEKPAVNKQAAALIRKQAERIAELELQPAFAQLASDLAVKLADTEAERDTLRAEVERLRVDAERWGKFIGLSYQVRAEWAANLSLVPVLTSWVDSLPANDTARKATQ